MSDTAGSRRTGRRTAAGMLVMLAVGAATLAACAGGPQVSGLPFLDSRTIREGEVLQITLPADQEAGTRWTISSFDGAMLSPAGNVERVERGGKPAYLARFRAQTPGETELVLRQDRTGKGPVFRSYTVRILD